METPRILDFGLQQPLRLDGYSSFAKNCQISGKTTTCDDGIHEKLRRRLTHRFQTFMGNSEHHNGHFDIKHYPV